MTTNDKTVVRIAGAGTQLAILLAMLLTAAGFSRAQSSAHGVGAPTFGGVSISGPADAPAALRPMDGSRQEGSQKEISSVSQGIKVHGHWVIDIRNPDGTLAAHRDFENSLKGNGPGFLIGLMSGYLVPGDYMIVAGPQSGNSACVGASYNYCGIVHNQSSYPALGYCDTYYCTGSTLSYTYNFGTDFGGPYSIVLSGSITANQTGTIGTVYTLISTCANIGFSNTVNPNSIETSSPAACVTQTSPQPWFGPLTQANITPVSVTSGQIIQATVTITFS